MLKYFDLNGRIVGIDVFEAARWIARNETGKWVVFRLPPTSHMHAWSSNEFGKGKAEWLENFTLDGKDVENEAPWEESNRVLCDSPDFLNSVQRAKQAYDD